MIYSKEVENVSIWKKDRITKDIFIVQVHIKCDSFIKFWKLFKLAWQQNSMKISQTESCIKILSFSDVSGTNSVSITSSTLRPIKDNLGIKTSEVQCSQCGCGIVYVDHTSRTNEIMCQEYIIHLQHGQTEKSAAAQHLQNTGHAIQFEKTHSLNWTTTYMDWIVKEAIEIQLLP
jgi:hypothetical protein